MSVFRSLPQPGLQHSDTWRTGSAKLSFCSSHLGRVNSFDEALVLMCQRARTVKPCAGHPFKGKGLERIKSDGSFSKEPLSTVDPNTRAGGVL